MSRAFENRMLKQFVVADPEVQEAVLIAQTEDDLEAGARKLTETAFARGSADMKFHHYKPNPEEISQHLEAKLKETKQACEPKPEVSQLDSEPE